MVIILMSVMHKKKFHLGRTFAVETELVRKGMVYYKKNYRCSISGIIVQQYKFHLIQSPIFHGCSVKIWCKRCMFRAEQVVNQHYARGLKIGRWP